MFLGGESMEPEGSANMDEGVSIDEQEVQNVLDADNAGDSPTPEEDEEQGGSLEDEDVEKLPFGKHPRWQKMQAEKKEMATELQTLKDQMASMEEAVALDKWMKEDPEGFKAWLKSKVAGGESTEEQQEGETTDGGYADAIAMLEDFEPDVATLFKRIFNQLEKYDKMVSGYENDKKSLEQQTVEKRQEAIKENRQELDAEFDNMAREAGYIDKDGNGDEQFMGRLARAVMAEMMSLAKNPHMPTKAEMKTAFENITSWTKDIEKKAALRTKKVTLPPSGSKNGQIPAGKVKQTEAERILAIANSII